MQLLCLLAMKLNHKTKEEKFLFFSPRAAECLVHQYAVRDMVCLIKMYLFRCSFIKRNNSAHM